MRTRQTEVSHQTSFTLKQGQTAKTWVEGTAVGVPVRIEMNLTLTHVGKATATLQIEQIAYGLDDEEGGQDDANGPF